MGSLMQHARALRDALVPALFSRSHDACACVCLCVCVFMFVCVMSCVLLGVHICIEHAAALPAHAAHICARGHAGVYTFHT